MSESVLVYALRMSYSAAYGVRSGQHHLTTYLAICSFIFLCMGVSSCHQLIDLAAWHAEKLQAQPA